MKFVLCLFILLLSFELSAQEPLKNNFYSSYSLVSGNRYSGGDFAGQGYTIGYSRYLKNKIYADISFGKLDYEGRNTIFFLPKEETGKFDMNFLTLGFGYDLIQHARFKLSSEVVFLRISNSSLQSQIGSGDYLTVRQTGRSSDITARVGLKARIFLTENVQLIPSLAYGFQIQNYETNWVNIGLGYSF